MSEISPSYLQSLKFEAGLLKKWNAKYLKNLRVITLIIIAIIAIGITSLIVLPRRLNPEIKLTIVSVSTILPGAGPADIEKLVTIPLEDKLTGVKGLDTISSTSRESGSFITMQFLSGTDKDKARNDVERAVSEVTSLPSDSQKPTVTAFDFENQPIWTFAVTSPEGPASLMRYADSLKVKINDISGIDRVELSGFDDREIQVVLNPEKIQQYGLNPISISNVVRNSTRSFPSGNVYTEGSTFPVAMDTNADSIAGIRNILLNIDDQSLKLGDIAKIYEKSKPNQTKTYIVRKDRKLARAVVFNVYKSTNADITTAVKKVEDVVNTDLKENQNRFILESILNSGELIGKQFSDLVGEFGSTLILVFINLFIFLGLRQALIASITIPLTFLTTFIWMNLLGQSINFLSLFALLLAFGTSIDDTIVTVSSMTSYFRTKKFSPLETGLLVWRDILVPIWTTTITTVWAFIPLLLSTGIIGEFIKPIPIIVAVTMYTSTFISWFITLPLIIVLLRPEVPRRVKVLFGILAGITAMIFLIILSPKNGFIPLILLSFSLFIWITYKVRHDLSNRVRLLVSGPKTTKIKTALSRVINHGVINTEKLGAKYKRLIMRILSSKKGRRIVFICIFSFAISSYLLLPLGLVKNEFFPKSNEDQIYVSLELPTGTNQKTLESISHRFLPRLENVSELEAITLETGASQGSNGATSPNANSSLFTLRLTPKEKRSLSSVDIASQLRRDLSDYTGGKVSVIEESGGPPAGADVQIKLLGSDLNRLQGYADKIVEFLSKTRGTANIEKSVKPSTSKLIFNADDTKLSQNKIARDSIGLWLRTLASGYKLDTVKFLDYEQDVVFYAGSTHLAPEELLTLSIPTNGSDTIPLSSLGSLMLENNPTIITREGGKRTVSVSATVLKGYSISDINTKLENYAKSELNLESGYEWKTGGVNEENTKSVQSIFRAMALSFILIMATMVIEFGSFRQAGMILSLIPFAISGVFIIFGITGTPLSFPALIGVLALFGVVVTNAMFIVDKINQNRRSGMDLIHSIADAGQTRLEPIMLTSLTSILGLIPITLANPLWRGLGGAIISGLMFSGIIMLFYIPVLYYTFYHKSESPNTVSRE